MKLDSALLNDLTAEAKASPRLRMNYDLRNSDADDSQRMLNALEPGTVVSVHRHRKSSETVVVVRGKRWHNTECLESGTVILECKNGAYEPLDEDDIKIQH